MNGEGPEMSTHLVQLGLTVAYFLLGLLMMGVSVWLIDKFAPFSIRKEIEEDQNTALGILMGCMFIAIAIVIGAVITS